jgi:hypothetical protein
VPLGLLDCMMINDHAAKDRRLSVDGLFKCRNTPLGSSHAARILPA